MSAIDKIKEQILSEVNQQANEILNKQSSGDILGVRHGTMPSLWN